MLLNYLFFILYALILIILFNVRICRYLIVNLFFSLVSVVGATYGLLSLMQGYLSMTKWFYAGIGLEVIVASIYGVLFGLRPGEKEGKKQKVQEFHLETECGNTLTLKNPFDNFLIYGSQGSGKTKSIGKNLLMQYIKYNWVGFVYDYKEGDYTRTAFELIKRFNYAYSVHHINFHNVSCSERVNVIKPSVVKDPVFFTELLSEFFIANMSKEVEKMDFFDVAAIGVLKGIGLRFFFDYPHICTLPHIVNYIAQTDYRKLEAFLNGRRESRGVAAAYVSGEQSEKTRGSILSALGAIISDFSINKQVQYILSGDDFEFNLLDPKNPKLLLLANNHQYDRILSPVVGMMASIYARSFTMENKLNAVNFLDEATTFKIANFEGNLSLLREYRLSTVILTQSPAKIEKRYGPLDLRSIETNCGNKFFGRNLDIIGVESSIKQFAAIDEKKVTSTTGSSTHSRSSSKSISHGKKKKYEPAELMKLKPGQFVGRAQNSNYTEFEFQFKQYVPGQEKDIEIRNVVLESDLIDCYNKIIDDIINIA
ncbi:type IV secretory system conjugative DNA transfer VirD4/TraG family protein [Chitinophaga skermanii]|uniref:Type IV secretory system conjugative DNA transfer VirD4/TraG family protein n=1 Tax=Chitinophaga skermanii TaxID=331697 RepID=A0A327Q579_9BACT|nr:type IV secretory system conjugative DNA transfer family protein [Chitinophaga skermanii]RAI97016.1 type IV secretory system conjugative DNA transfer VirD4/TraG family protein [Chitinophaga skermanii]